MNEMNPLELKISRFLRVGVLVSVFFMLIGWLSSFQLTANPYSHFSLYETSSPAQNVALAFQSRSWGILCSYVGLSLLISLPVIRVFLTALLLVRTKEYALAFIALAVLLSLLLSFSLGIEI